MALLAAGAGAAGENMDIISLLLTFDTGGGTMGAVGRGGIAGKAGIGGSLGTAGGGGSVGTTGVGGGGVGVDANAPNMSSRD